MSNEPDTEIALACAAGSIVLPAAGVRSRFSSVSTAESEIAAEVAAGDRRTELYPPAATPPGRMKKSLAERVFPLMFFLLCGVLGYTIASMFHDVINVHPLTLLLGFVVALWPNVILHEAGHALCGLARGMRAMAFGIGPFRFERGSDGWHARRAEGVRGISGFASLIPGQERKINRSDQAWFLFGGPLANLVTAGIGLAILAVGDTAWSVGDALLLGASASALLLALVNLMPFRSHGWRSDGRNLIDLAFGRPDALLQMQIVQIMGISAVGVRPRDWPDGLVPSPSPLPSRIDPLLAISADLLRLSRAVDQGDAALAESCALSVVSRFADVPALVQAHAATGIASYVAVLRQDPDLLDAWLSLSRGGLTDLSAFHDWLRAEHAVLTDRVGEARTAIARAEANVGRIYDEASVILLREHLDALKARLATPDVAMTAREPTGSANG